MLSLCGQRKEKILLKIKGLDIDEKAVIELSKEEVLRIAACLYKRLDDEWKNWPSIKEVYSDFLVLCSLIESGRVDNWTIERTVHHREIEIEKGEP